MANSKASKKRVFIGERNAQLETKQLKVEQELL